MVNLWDRTKTGGRNKTLRHGKSRSWNVWDGLSSWKLNSKYSADKFLDKKYQKIPVGRKSDDQEPRSVASAVTAGGGGAVLWNSKKTTKRGRKRLRNPPTQAAVFYFEQRFAYWTPQLGGRVGKWTGGCQLGWGWTPPPGGERVQIFKVIFHGIKMRNIIVTILPVW